LASAHPCSSAANLMELQTRSLRQS
jgi:hypothetical protein